MRDEFSEETKETLARRVAMHCSNPDCRKPTTGPRDDPEKAVNIGVAAHITAASPGGPRYDKNLTAPERKAVDNGIWLCQNCAKLIDNDEDRYTVDALREWKRLSEEAARSGIETSATTQAPELVPEVLLPGQEGGGQPVFHRRINDPWKRGTSDLRITGTALYFSLRVRNDGGKQTSLGDVWVRAHVGGKEWEVRDMGSGLVNGVWSDVGSVDVLRTGQILTIPPRDFVETRVLLVTDRCVPDEVLEIKGEIHCEPRWGSAAVAPCVFKRTDE